MMTRLALFLPLLLGFETLVLPVAGAQVLRERSLGRIAQMGSISGASVLSPDGMHFARRERVGDQERYVTLDGAQGSFDRILPGAIWVGDRLVYYAVLQGKTVWMDGKRKLLLLGQPTSPALAGRHLPSKDHQTYLSFGSDGKRVAWYLDGVLQPRRFQRLALVDITQPAKDVLFAGYNGCELQLMGQAASASARWDILHWVRATLDARQVYVYGQRGGIPQLHLNGKRLLSLSLADFAVSQDGLQWMAVAEESSDGQGLISLWQNGKRVGQADADGTRQSLHFSADGQRWAWRIVDEDYRAATVRLQSPEGASERRLEPDPAEYRWSSDGRHEAQLRFTRGDPALTEILINQVLVGSHSGVRKNSLQVFPGGNWYYVVVDADGSQRVVSSQGVGEVFDEISQIVGLPSGQPGYAASRAGVRYLVWGQQALATTADFLHDVATLAWRDSALSVTGQRTDEVLLFSVHLP